MRERWLRAKVVSEFRNLITRSCSSQKMIAKSKDLHTMLLKKHYNAIDISIDYHRNRVYMDIVLDDSHYSSRKLIVTMPVMKANIWYGSLHHFLKSCIDNDDKSIAFYASLLQAYKTEKTVAAKTSLF